MNRINVYTCKQGHKTITRDLDEGTTSMFIGCRVRGCDEMAASAMYRVPQNLMPSFEWYKPTRRELLKLKRNNKSAFEHCMMGGLLLRRIGQRHVVEVYRNPETRDSVRLAEMLEDNKAHNKKRSSQKRTTNKKKLRRQMRRLSELRAKEALNQELHSTVKEEPNSGE